MPESGPPKEGFSRRGAVMKDDGNAARKMRKLRASRDLWKQRSAEKQQEIRQLRVTVRDLSSSREHWKTRVNELDDERQLFFPSVLPHGKMLLCGMWPGTGVEKRFPS